MQRLGRASGVAAVLVATLGYASTGAASGVPASIGVAPAIAVPAALTAPAPAPPANVLPPTAVAGSRAPVPTTAGLATALKPLLSDAALGSRTSTSVLDIATGTALLDDAGATPATPASTLKILTTVAALRALGPNARLATRTVASAPGEIVLVGAGDTTLSSRARTGSGPEAVASLPELARRTAAALVKQQTTSVRVILDASLFSGPRLAPGWASSYPALGIASPVVALTVDSGRASADGKSRVADPVARAGQVFADALRSNGITVSGVSEGVAPADAKPVAAVYSPTVADLVERTLTESDNDLAEALNRLAGAKLGGGGSFTGGAAAIAKVLSQLGVPTAGLRLVDGSGLSRQDAVAATTLTRTLAAVVAGKAPYAWPMLTGLPVAGFTGTLADRFTGLATRAGAGVVRAKTGTLTGVSALAGFTRTVDGRLVSFAVLADRITSIPGAREVLDRTAAKIAGCGCR